MPASAVLTAATVPSKVIVASAVPSPVVNVSPVVPPSVSVPCVAVSVTRTSALPASESAIAIALPAPKVSVAFSLTDWAPGTVLTGASLTGVTATDLPPLVAVASPSSAVKRTVRVADVGF